MPTALRDIAVRAVELARGAVELALPGVCALCQTVLGVDPGPVCRLCRSRVIRLPHPQCARCGHPAPHGSLPGDPCRWCEPLPPWIRAVRSVAWVEPKSVASGMVHALKYDGWPRVAVAMAAEMARLSWPIDVQRERAFLIPVPLAPWRERERGYNQAHALAAALAPHWAVPVAPALHRTRMPVSQTRLTPGERLVNVTRAFAVSSAGSALVQGAHCVLVDDVVTTAATLTACADALVAGGARIISCVTFGRAPAIGDRRSPLE